ncbi:MAG: LysM domain-containing protein [Desulfobacteraceae bacterium]|nr:MAG: LysM domain-containing protein [Desulfobacteraceae bacterium]
MIHLFTRPWPTGLLLVIILLAAGCSRVQPAPEEAKSAPVMEPAEAGRVKEIQPLHLAAVQPQPAPPEPEYFVHTVRNRGETLSAIAAWYTGSSANWVQLAGANAGLDPKRIQMGTTILIPEEILTTRLPMPKTGSPPAAKKKLPAPLQRPQPVEVELFGPIENAQPPGVVNDPGLPQALQTLDQ